MGMYSLAGFVGGYKHFDEIQEISGSSAGSIVGLLIALGLTQEEIKDLLFKLDFKSLIKLNIKSFIKNFGFISWENFKNLFVETFGSDIKFKDLKKKLYVSVYCVETNRIEYLSVDTHPEMNVVDACCMSCSIPFLFESCVYNKLHYIDAGVVEEFPSVPFIGKPKEEIIVVRLNFVDNQTKFEITNIIEYVLKTTQNILDNRHTNLFGFNQISIDIDYNDSVDFYMNDSKKLQLYMKGFNTAFFMSYSNNND